MKNLIAIGLLLITLPVASFAKGVYLEVSDFVEAALGEPVPPKQLWLTGVQREVAGEILGHKMRALRVRYWQNSEQRSAWVFDEIGKELPITIGVVIAAGEIADLKILAFRESRGGEVRYPFFTDQFRQLSLTESQNLSGNIDGVSGATLSVRAVKRVARLALYLDQQRAAANGL